jgi:hypothetical protein
MTTISVPYDVKCNAKWYFEAKTKGYSHPHKYNHEITLCTLF